jgi:hypothetical protein
MKKLFSLIVAISILEAVAAPGFAQGRNTRIRREPVPNPRQRDRVPPSAIRIAGDLGTVFGTIFNSRTWRIQDDCLSKSGPNSRYYMPSLWVCR